MSFAPGGLSPDGIIAEQTSQYGVYAYAGDVLGYLDGAARALEAVELIAGSYGKKELGEKARGLRERMEGELIDYIILCSILMFQFIQ